MVATQHASPMAAGVLKNLESGLAPAKAAPPVRPTKPSTEIMKQLEQAKANSQANSPAPKRPPLPKETSALVEPVKATSQPNSQAPKRPPLPKEMQKIKERINTHEEKVGDVGSAQKEADISQPAHRFLVSMQGHGYPWSLVTEPMVGQPQAASSEHAEVVTLPVEASNTGPAKDITSSPVVLTQERLAGTVDVPAYRFISTMAGHYGFPQTHAVVGAQIKRKEQHVHKDSQMAKLFTSMSIKTKTFVNSVMTHKPTKAGKNKQARNTDAVVPAYRFLTSMQGYGYPITHTVMPVVPKTAVADTATQNDLVVPAYRFMTSMQGHGYPYTPAMSPKEAAKAKRSFMESVMGGATHLINSIKSSTKSAKTALPSTDKVDDGNKKSGPAVPAYRFMTSMQGHGYPVTNMASRSSSLTAKKQPPAKRKSIMQEFMGKLTDVKGGNHKIAKVLEPVEIPAYRFMTSMQGYGYPVVPRSPTAEKPPTRPNGHPAPFKVSIDKVCVEAHKEAEGESSKKDIETQQLAKNKPQRPKSLEKQNGFMKFFKKLTTKTTKPASAKASKESLHESAEHKNKSKGKAKGKEAEQTVEAPKPQEEITDKEDTVVEDKIETPKTE
ncbi:hypothetical protein SARC_12400 [Sphaeroforma arctica JP610]|uniref:Uncharacterized protein n=1 Tax=Sphaeroforma arctica JP610 TaxID=667725 RepID=A0A0L0FGC5_9EUKA|nr:hypothetical protein SARC_12400 [Sphaeroforma arctica JP610]KNC75068.1 hypothetical protein SARC_12400 [Sphaeroforma arctica JP610]|eukprot:XP_014148970.1 hypothetical protein SARC_12400 [Sphaeroforma arctica JP610]